METMAKISNQEEWAFNHPEKLEPTDLWYDDGADHLIIGFFRGGGMFEVTAPGAPFPEAVGIFTFGLSAVLHMQLVRLVAAKARDQLYSFKRSQRSLTSFLHSWTI